MTPRTPVHTPVRLAALTAATLLLIPGGAAAASETSAGTGPGHLMRLERLDRGLVAVDTDNGVHLGWRLLAHEVTGHTDTGLTGPDFRVYRDGKPITTVADGTNLLDAEGTADSEYRVAAVVRGREQQASEAVAPWADGHLDIPLQQPEGGTTPVGEDYTHTANDVSVGDVDGDGQYEFVVKWDPTNSKDVSQVGYTGNTLIDTYTLDGTLLNRIDLGVNIRSGAHYTQFLVYDLDGDGRAELMFKTAPGTKSTTYGSEGEVIEEGHVTLPKEDVAAGVTHDEDHRMSAEDYHDHVVDMFLGWYEHPEVLADNWPATLEEAFGIDPEYDYPLSRVDAEALADHLMDVYAPGRSENNRLREFEGFVVDGPEYLTVFDGLTGQELDTIPYNPGRGDDGLLWGDYAMSRVEPGNRVDRFLAGVVHLDGRTPSAIFARGYYTRSVIVAHDFDGERIRERWVADSGHVPMDNPFDDTPHGGVGTDPEHGTLAGQGFHSLSVADVDGDHRQEIVYGAATLNSDGTLRYSSHATLPPGSGSPGESVKLGHGDAMHTGRFTPDGDVRIWTVHEGATWAPYGQAMRDADTGEVLFGTYSGRDTGRGMVGDVDPASPGYEVWSSMPPGEDGDGGLWSAEGERLGEEVPGTNMSIRWAGDMTTQIIEGAEVDGVVETPTIEDWNRGTLLNAEGTSTNNGTKGNPSLVADVFGDWREELVLRTEDGTALRVHTSTEETEHMLHTLMHDPQYRVGIASQQTTYNQPTYPEFYLGSDTDWSRVTVPRPLYPRP
ncbi:Predicted rhamnogalacturonan lyase in rhamnose utilization cluster [Nocardiopsis sp. JB363]|nr:Predicted rhamnogalacturonan lyase in rhamnose utilization cluster [Nocardiopsis sp. JB363]